MTCLAPALAANLRKVYVSDVIRLNSQDFVLPLSSSFFLCGNVHGQNGGTAADIENNLVLEEVLVLHNGIHV